MKKLILFALNMLMLASTIQPALAVGGDEIREMHDYGDPETVANGVGMAIGAATGLMSGLGWVGGFYAMYMRKQQSNSSWVTPVQLGSVCCQMSSLYIRTYPKIHKYLKV